MIIIQMSGGLGNQMFQYALGIQLEALGRKVTFDTRTMYRGTPGAATEDDGRDRADAGNAAGVIQRMPMLERAFGIQVPECSEEDRIRITDSDPSFTSKVRRRLFGRKSLEKHDRNFRFDPSFLEETGDAYYVGCFQCPAYFQRAEEETGAVRKAFRFRSDILEGEEARDSARACEKIRGAEAEGEETLAVHLRFGDYVTKADVYGGFCTDEYYHASICGLLKCVHAPAHAFVFSNDEKMAADWIQREEERLRVGKDASAGAENAADSVPSPIRFTLVTGSDEGSGFRDLYLLSLCRHFIIANSSFSWWGAYLGKKKNTRIYAPSRWTHLSDGEGRREEIYTPDMILVGPDGTMEAMKA